MIGDSCEKILMHRLDPLGFRHVRALKMLLDDNLIWKIMKIYEELWKSYDLILDYFTLKLRWTHMISHVSWFLRPRGQGRTSHAFNAICKAFLQLDLAHQKRMKKCTKHMQKSMQKGKTSSETLRYVRYLRLIFSCIVDNKNVVRMLSWHWNWNCCGIHEVGAWPVRPVRSS